MLIQVWIYSFNRAVEVNELFILDGRTHTVTYIAGAGIGFQPTGDDIHPEVAAGIELNLKNPPQETTTLKQ